MATTPATAPLPDAPTPDAVPPVHDTAAASEAVAWTEPVSKRGDPVWELAARLHPLQGHWTLEQYHDLLDQDEDLRVEFANGCLEFLPVPTEFHENIANYLLFKLYEHLGLRNVHRGGYEIVTANGRGRFPDVLASRTREGFGPKRATAADLVIEVVSPGSVQHQRDFADKRADYAATGVGEYWIVDPEAKTLMQLRLDGTSYVEVGVFAARQTVTCESIPGFVVVMDDLLKTASE